MKKEEIKLQRENKGKWFKRTDLRVTEERERKKKQQSEGFKSETK